jgi:hypothetical protein
VARKGRRKISPSNLLLAEEAEVSDPIPSRHTRYPPQTHPTLLGHNSVLQNYLHVQRDNRTSADLVTLTVEYVACAAEELNAKTVDLVTQGFETLVEMADGCSDNQRAIFGAKAVDIVNTILRTPDIESACDQQLNKVALLKMALAKLIMTMVEDTSPDAAKLAKVRARNLG